MNGQDGLNQQDRNVAENIVTYADSGTRYYTRKNPHVADPNDPNDPRTQDDWDLTQGVVVKIALHKTGAKYPMYLWFSCFQLICLCKRIILILEYDQVKISLAFPYTYKKNITMRRSLFE